MRLKLLFGFLLIGCKSIGAASTELSLSRVNDFVLSIISIVKGHVGKPPVLMYAFQLHRLDAKKILVTVIHESPITFLLAFRVL